MKLINAIFATALLAMGSMSVQAGPLIPNAGAAYGIACNGADGVLASDSVGLGCRIGDEYLTTRLVWQKLFDAPVALAIPLLVDGTDSDVREFMRWQPIGAVREGGVYLGDHRISVSGVICVPTECIGIGDQMQVLNWSGSVAQVIIDGRFETIGLRMDDHKIVIGSERLGYVIHAER